MILLQSFPYCHATGVQKDDCSLHVMIFFYLVLVDVFVVYTKRILKIAIY